jgi:hypothetical protein
MQNNACIPARGLTIALWKVNAQRNSAVNACVKVFPGEFTVLLLALLIISQPPNTVQ